MLDQPAQANTATERLGDTEEQFRLFLESVTDYALFFTDPERRVATWNAGAERVLGYTEAEMIGRSGDIIFTPEDRRRGEPEKEMAQALREGRAEDERWHVRKDGSRFWASGVMTALRDEAQDLRGFCKILRDRTEQRRVEESLRASTEELREQLDFTQSLVSGVAEGIYAVNENGEVTLLNPAGERLLGWTEADLRGKNIHEAIHYRRADGTPFPREECPLLEVLRSGVVLRDHEDVFLRRDGSPFPVLCSSAPIRKNGAIGGAVLAFTDITERKRDEARLADAYERERNIARQLQAALQPALPAPLSGLSLKEFYRAAWEEANVGGDFFDVFPVENGCYALVVGDVSGKGLEAAAQVATVRNMLRFALYEGHTVADAVRRFNRIVAENNLLQGFATLFVGVYDPDGRILNYVSCGQEPALVRRAASGAVEELGPTGPLLGVLSEADFDQRAVLLAPGDALAIFTDGLTDVGPRHGALLGIEGIAAVLREHTPGESAPDLVARLVTAAEAHARDGLQDDICLLVGIVEPPFPV